MEKGKKYRRNEQVKTIIIHLNGVNYFQPVKVLLDAKKDHPWFRVLEEITKKLHQAIITKHLFVADSGTLVTNFSELKNNEHYVASATKNYLQLDNSYKNKQYRVKYLNLYSNCALWLKNLNNKLSNVRPDLLIIYVFKNNEVSEHPKKIVMTQRDLINWKHTLEHIARLLDLQKGVIQYLYTTNGQKTCGPWELQHGANYVAVEFDDKFVPCDYDEQISVSKQKWRYGVPYYYKPKTERCDHQKLKHLASWDQQINWKNFNERYADLMECVCQSKSPCQPLCDCRVHKYTVPCTSYWARDHHTQTLTSSSSEDSSEESEGYQRTICSNVKILYV